MNPNFYDSNEVNVEQKSPEWFLFYFIHSKSVFEITCTDELCIKTRNIYYENKYNVGWIYFTQLFETKENSMVSTSQQQYADYFVQSNHVFP